LRDATAFRFFSGNQAGCESLRSPVARAKSRLLVYRRLFGVPSRCPLGEQHGEKGNVQHNQDGTAAAKRRVLWPSWKRDWSHALAGEERKNISTAFWDSAVIRPALCPRWPPRSP
jgi:hypothetical protein